MASSPVYFPPSSTIKFGSATALSSSQFSESGNGSSRSGSKQLLLQPHFPDRSQRPKTPGSRSQPVRSPAESTPRTVRLISNDNYSYSPTNFSVFPVFDQDTLDIAQNYDLMGTGNQCATWVDDKKLPNRPPNQWSHYLFHPLADELPNHQQCPLPNLPTSDPIVEYPSLYESSSFTTLNAPSSPPQHPFTFNRSYSGSEASKIQISSFFELDDFSDISEAEANELDDEDDNDFEAEFEDLGPDAFDSPLIMTNLPREEKGAHSLKTAPSNTQPHLELKGYEPGFANMAQPFSAIEPSPTPSTASLCESTSGTTVLSTTPPSSVVSKKRLFDDEDENYESKPAFDDLLSSLVFDMESKTHSLFKSSVKIPLPPFSKSRYMKITEMAAAKNLDLNQVDEVIKLFKLRNFDIKLKILSRVLGENPELDTSYPTHTDDRGLVLTESSDGGLNILAKTYAGHEDSSLIFDNSIISCFRDVKEFAIYFKQPNDTASKARKASNPTKKQRVDNPESTLDDSNEAPQYIKRPLNSFMLYRTTIVKAVVLLSLIDSLSSHVFGKLRMTYSSYDPKAELDYLKALYYNLSEPLIHQLRRECFIHKYNHHLLIQIVAVMWSTEINSVKKTFVSLAQSEKKIHAKCYPNYKYHPQRRG
ncbi:hypothetical protein OGAPHI_006860 [Ogataea philodendri]|uniref:Uncharacterized protein n=1 Tax=Ogataea philodendri TaxID=1378263 RepID=A0A9P8SZN0_9ASCO|nr:uncharacterized protein OGAPHI_006860 [Ogataea philodendri]KAH3660274.1 hypothetical protein OGAPHI_006860 [Ogataea philodendri]